MLFALTVYILAISSPWLLVDAWTVCCPDTGCFTSDPPYEGADSLPPNCIVPIYTLFKGNMAGSASITLGNTPNQFDRTKNTIFIVHGWQNNGRTEWVVDAKNRLTSRFPTYNIVVVDWGESASSLNYAQSSSDIRQVGAYTALIVTQLNAAYDYCVGHSLGAHTCGLTGKDSNLNRITGLDPAGPFFEDSCQRSPTVCRLHPTDAAQVDVIHTDGKERPDHYGTLIPMGHQDFYPNAGGLQPGCIDYATLVNTPEKAVACSHGRACEYYLISIDNDCFVVREKCSDYNNIPGSCYSANCPNMGYYTSWGDGLYYLTTSAESPWCLR